MAIEPLQVLAYTATSAAGRGNSALSSALREGRSGLRRNDMPGSHVDTWIGRVESLEAVHLPDALRPWNCRNNQLAYLAVQQDGFAESVALVREKYGSTRIGLFLGTSTSGVAATEAAYRTAAPEFDCLPPDFSYQHSQNIGSLLGFLRALLGIDGVGWVISTACSSSARVFATAWRALHCGYCDVAVVGGADSLCHTTLEGFHSLQLTSTQPCRPFTAGRDGISIGEAAGFALVSLRHPGRGLEVQGYGESSDAYHMSSPDPDGRGAEAAMVQALQRADCLPERIDYINLHGTGTQANDIAEAQAVKRVFESGIACSSTKPITGHALGAAGILEAVICLLCLEQQFLPVICAGEPDPDLGLHPIWEGGARPLEQVLTNSFGFGGSNATILMGHARV